MDSTSTCCLVFALILCSQVALSQAEEEYLKSCSLSKWANFKDKYSKNYATQDDGSRMEIFCKNLQTISKHNANPSNTFKMGINQFTDYTQNEIDRMLGKQAVDELKPVDEKRLVQLVGGDLNVEPPEEVDWSLDASRVSPARDQGDCGSCWAFGTVALLEGQEKPRNKTPVVELSEQNLIDCDMRNEACVKGTFVSALNEIKRNGGVMRLSDYPYVSGKTGVEGPCKMNRAKAYVSTTYLGKVQTLKGSNETLLKQVVASYGPVAVSIQANAQFLAYSSGVFYDSNCQVDINHGLVVVGYGRDAQTGLDYWKVKNSFGPSWGLDGFALMSRNRANNCLIASYPVIVWPDEG